MTEANNFTNTHTNVQIMSLSNMVYKYVLSNIYILAIIARIPLTKKKKK